MSEHRSDHEPEFEPPDEQELAVDRRGFLKVAGFAFTSAGLAGCSGRAPIEQAIPFLVQPEDVTPGQAVWYASTCGGCSAGCGLLVKNRDGRPVKLEGNPRHPLNQGRLCAVGQAHLLGLYDSQRLRGPLLQGKPSTWEQVDGDILARLDGIRRRGGRVRVLTDTIHGPTGRSTIERFLAGFADGRQVVYDPLSATAILAAHELTHGLGILPRYRFEQAEVVVGIDADFLATWLSPVEYTAGYRAAREPQQHPEAYHLQVESRLSLTGACADERLVLPPSRLGALVEELRAAVFALAGLPGHVAPEVAPIAERLWRARGRCLVVCGVNDLGVQVACNRLNQVLGAYGSSIDLEGGSFQKTGRDDALAGLLNELSQGQVDALIVSGVNPAYDLPDGAAWAAALQRVPLLISLAERVDETAALAYAVCPDHHALEAWDDAEPVNGLLGLRQPVIAPLGQTRGRWESLSYWSGAKLSGRELVQNVWREQVWPWLGAGLSFESFWDRALAAGVVEGRRHRLASAPPQAVTVPITTTAPGQGWELLLYPKVGMLDGRHGHNPWLHELPDPVSKVTWDNYASLSPKAAESLRVTTGDLVQIEVGGQRLELPVLVQRGQDDTTIAVALGYGRAGTERFALAGPNWLGRRPQQTEGQPIGRNAAPLLGYQGGLLRYQRAGVRVAATGQRRELAATQTHHELTVDPKLSPSAHGPRPLVQAISLAEYRRDPHAGAPAHHETPELWPRDHTARGHRWVMVIDLDACTGCSACVLACQAENNVPVVGWDEVRRRREMHWLRIDSYYVDGPNGLEVEHQPMLCQHCEHAPCETVCPVLATVHSAEGLNQQVYNRCVGTRYCANNCPYKVRRFNWFDYPHEDRLQNLALNPDVTVRSRGVMEKCSFCIQRIQEARITARREGRALADGEIAPACLQTCPAGAIVFGDANDPASEVSRRLGDPRRFQVLSELNTRPAVNYLRPLRRRPEASEGGAH